MLHSVSGASAVAKIALHCASDLIIRLQDNIRGTHEIAFLLSLLSQALEAVHFMFKIWDETMPLYKDASHRN